MSALPKGWTRPNRDARFATDLFELHVRRDFAGERYSAMLHANGETLIIGEGYTTEAEAIAAALRHARSLVRDIARMLD